MGFLEDLAANNQLHWSDIVVVVVYFIAVIGVGIWSSCRNRGSTSGYFLAGRSMHFIPVGASLFASNIGSGHFIGLAGSGAASGIGIAVFELNAIFTLLLLGWVFVPVYIAAGVFTMPEYLRKRFGGQRIRVYLALLALLLYIFTKISADLYSGAVFIKQSLGWNIWISAVALLLLSCFFTVAGGLTAVIWTDFIQTIVMIVGAFVLMGISFTLAGGYDSIVEGFMGSRGQSNLTRMCLQGALNSSACAHAAACGTVPANSMHFFRSVDDPDLPATGVLIGLTISGVWYWCSDQVIVQRALAAKNLSHAKAGTVLAGFMKFLPMWIMVLPGMIARVLYPDILGCSDPSECESICGSRAGCTNMAYPLLVVQVMPNGARGLMLAVMMSALISSLTSIFNSSSTIFTMDVWKRIRRQATDVELMIVGRLFVVALVGVSIAWIPIVQSFSELFHYIQQITSYLSPPVCAVYVLAMFVKRVNEQGAFWGLVVGLVMGLVRFGWEFAYSIPACGEEDPRPAIISRMHYLHFGIILFVVVCIVTLVISVLTPPIDAKHLVRLTYFGRHEEGERLDMSIAEEDERLRAAAAAAERGSGVRGESLELGLAASSSSSSGVLSSMQQLAGDGVGAPSIAYSAGVYQALPWYRKALNWICGIEDMKETQGAAAAAAPADDKHLSIEEDPRWRRWNDAGAVLLAVCAVFVWGLFA